MYKEEAIELFTAYFQDEDDEFEFTRVEIALFEKFFREGGEFFSLTEIKNELTQFSDEELMQGLDEAVRKGIITESVAVNGEPMYLR